MSCVVATPRFRLLDPLVGWGEETAESLQLHDPAGLRLLGPEDRGITGEALSPYLPPAWFARDRTPRGWWMLGRGEKPRLLRWDDCGDKGQGSWRDVLGELAGHELLRTPAAIAVRGPSLAISDPRAASVFVWSWPDGRLLARIAMEKPRAVAFAPWGGLLVAGRRALHQFDLAGEERGVWPWQTTDPIRRMAGGRDGAAWVATGPGGGPYQVARFGPAPTVPGEPIGPDGPTEHAPPDVEFLEPGPFAIERGIAADRLAAGLPRTGLASDPGDGVCLLFCDDQTRCFTRDGRPARPEDVAPSSPPSGPATGELTTQRLDSGIPRCEWHRVRLDADIPPGSEVVVEVAAVEGDEDRPDKSDWEVLPDPLDSLIRRQPAGRYLFVRMTLGREGRLGPTIRRVRLDFPRSTGLDRLPAVYRDNPVAEDFTARFLAMFDATIGDMDRAIETFASLLDPGRVPEEALTWLGSMFGLTFAPTWTAERRRALIAAMPELVRLRGTSAGLARAIRLLFDVEPAIVETPQTRSWGAIGCDARLRSTRLFGASRSRFRMGRSALGSAPLRSYGNPDLDPFRDVAGRFVVMVPAAPTLDSDGVRRLDGLIAEQKPAHALHSLRVGGFGLVVGPLSAVGIDTRLAEPSPPVLNGPAGSVRLNHSSILRPGPRARPAGLVVGRATVGVQAILE